MMKQQLGVIGPYLGLLTIPLLVLKGSADAQNSKTSPDPPANDPAQIVYLQGFFPGSPKRELRYRAYAGPVRPESQIAILYLRRSGSCASKPCPPPGILEVRGIDDHQPTKNRNVALLNWDGTLREGCKAALEKRVYGGVTMRQTFVYCKQRFNTVELLPGTHTLYFASDDPRWGFTAMKTLTVEAGKKYRAELVEDNSYGNTAYNVAYGTSVTTLHIWLSVVISEIKPDEHP